MNTVFGLSTVPTIGWNPTRPHHLPRPPAGLLVDLPCSSLRRMLARIDTTRGQPPAPAVRDEPMTPDLPHPLGVVKHHHSDRRSQRHCVMLKPLPIGQLDIDQRDLHPSAAVNLRLAVQTPARLLIFEHASGLADGAAPLSSLPSRGSTVVGLLSLPLKETGTRRPLRQTKG
jgi:hypothetical protein